MMERPSGQIDVVLAGPTVIELRRLQGAYRLARHPKPAPEEVEQLPVTLEEVQTWLEEIGVM
jgi:hypothetical protein